MNSQRYSHQFISLISKNNSNNLKFLKEFKVEMKNNATTFQLNLLLHPKHPSAMTFKSNLFY